MDAQCQVALLHNELQFTSEGLLNTHTHKERHLITRTKRFGDKKKMAQLEMEKWQYIFFFKAKLQILHL